MAAHANCLYVVRAISANLTVKFVRFANEWTQQGAADNPIFTTKQVSIER